MDKCEKRVNEELQAARMVELRKALNYIKETEWQYEPIEKLIGQAWYIDRVLFVSFSIFFHLMNIEIKTDSKQIKYK